MLNDWAVWFLRLLNFQNASACFQWDITNAALLMFIVPMAVWWILVTVWCLFTGETQMSRVFSTVRSRVIIPGLGGGEWSDDAEWIARPQEKCRRRHKPQLTRSGTKSALNVQCNIILRYGPHVPISTEAKKEKNSRILWLTVCFICKSVLLYSSIPH